MRIFSLIFCILNAELINAQSPTQDSLSTKSVKSDSSFSPKDSSKTTNRIAVPTDTSVVVDTIEAPKSDIDTRIQYSCRDSIRMSMAEQRVYLYGEAKVVYGTKNIQAEYLIINWVTNEVSAYGKLDTLTDNTIGKPLFKDGSDMYIADSIRYNMKSGKGIIKGIVTRQGDGFIHGGPVKRTTEAIYVKHALYTTCDLPHPHFSINATKLKVIPGDKVVTGPFHMEIMGIPTPLGLPLGFFPVTQRSKSGIIPPGIGESTSRGFHITNGGYYWAVNDYVGTNVFGDLYANKSYRISTQTNYIKRYCYSGLTAFSYSNIKEGFADTIKAPKLFNFRWTHKTLGNKPSRLSADVNISSSKYYTSNSYNPINQQSTNFASNITWSKTFRKIRIPLQRL
jgi:lipopolysaccharide assembly outer membrane protein LptD (OstA)